MKERFAKVYSQGIDLRLISPISVIFSREVRRAETRFFSSACLDGISPVVVPCPCLKTRGFFWAPATFSPRNRAVGCVAFSSRQQAPQAPPEDRTSPTFRLLSRRRKEA